MKKRLFSLIICLFLFMSLFSGFLNFVYAPAGDGIVEIDVNPQGTFLRAVNWYPRWAPGPSDLTPTIVDLGANGLNPGDVVVISFQGNWSYNAGWERPETTTYAEAEKVHLLALFSASSSISAMTNLNRVAGAIDYGEDFVTANTWWEETLQKRNDDGTYDPPLKGGNQTTDIPEDFRITPYTGMEIKIPNNAKFLMFAHHTRYLPCARGNIKVILELDSDGDGIPDNWEINGIDYDKDGEIDLNLPMLGADWEHKDIFVEVDYMNAHRPNQYALDSVIEAFRNAPVTNPDMVTGINLHIIVDEIVPYKEVLSGFGEFNTLKSSYFGTENERLEQKTIEAKKKVFRYCLSVDKIWFDPPDNWIGPPVNDCPGIAEGIACDDFIVAFGAFSTNSIEAQASVFMHELGHCLGLRHGGGDWFNYKPNYLSIMNYRFQYPNFLPERPMDYSRKELPSINETSIDEALGIGVATKTVWYASFNIPREYYVSLGNLAIDWDIDGAIASGLKLDLNNDLNILGTPSSYEMLKGYNDWLNLVYRFRGTPLYSRSATLNDYHIELTNKQIEEMNEVAKTIIEVSSPEPSEQPQDLPTEILYVIGIVMIGIIVSVVYMIMIRKKKKSNSKSNKK